MLGLAKVSTWIVLVGPDFRAIASVAKALA